MPEECCCICHDPTGIPSKDWRAVYRSIDRFCSALVCSVYCLARYEPLPVLMSCIPQILVNFFWMFHLASTLLSSVDDIVATLFKCVILLSQYTHISCKQIHTTRNDTSGNSPSRFSHRFKIAVYDPIQFLQ